MEGEGREGRRGGKGGEEGRGYKEKRYILEGQDIRILKGSERNPGFT